MELFLGIFLTAIAIALLFIILMGVFYAIDLFLDLPFVGTKKDKVATIIKLAQIKKNGTVIDLGSGDGRLLFAAAEKGAYAIGYELNPFLVLLSRFHAKLKGVEENVKVYQKNFWKADLKVADVIFVYSLKKTIGKFEEFVYKNAKPGTRVVVNLHPFPTKRPIKDNEGIYLYIK